MKKCDIIEPKGIFNSLTYTSDSAGCGYIRCILPNTYINSWRYKDLSFNFTNIPIFINDINYYKHMSYVKFQRSATSDQLTMFKYFIKNIQNQTNTGLLYESDDNLITIPKSNFAHDYYIKNKPYIEEMLSIVDGITVSTGYLKKIYSKYNKNISVVKNRLCKYLWGEVKKRKSFENVGKKFRILYPGSQNHFSCDSKIKGGDIGPTFMDFIKKTTNKYDWIFLGAVPNELIELVKNNKITLLPWVNILQYPSYLKSLNVDLGIAPLEINDFNKAKSNLKMLEYTICGIPGIYTNIEPYRYAKNKADTEDYFIHLIEMMETNIDLRKKSWQADYNLLKSDLFLEDNIKKWINENLKPFNKMIN